MIRSGGSRSAPTFYMKRFALIAGDIFAILIVTLIGFASHGEVGAGSPGPYTVLPRMAAIFFPLTIAWFVLAVLLRLFDQEKASLNRLWRPALAMIFVGPMAAVLRGLLLNVPVIPIFAVVLSFTSALGILVWRTVFYFFNRAS